MELSEGRRTLKEEISIDITKGTETFHVLKTSLNESAGDTIYDFKKGNICLYSLNKILWVGKGGEVLNSFFKTKKVSSPVSSLYWIGGNIKEPTHLS